MDRRDLNASCPFLEVFPEINDRAAEVISRDVGQLDFDDQFSVGFMYDNDPAGQHTIRAVAHDEVDFDTLPSREELSKMRVQEVAVLTALLAYTAQRVPQDWEVNGSRGTILDALTDDCARDAAALTRAMRSVALEIVKRTDWVVR